MSSPVRVKEERVSVSFPTRLPDPAALVCSKLTSIPSLSVSSLVSGSDAERAETSQLLLLQLSRCHHTEKFDLELDGAAFSTLLRTASSPLQVRVCELLVAFIKAVYVDTDIVDSYEGIRSSGELLSFYRLIHNDIVKFALSNVKAGDHCALFLCNLLSTCSSLKVFRSVVQMFGESVAGILSNGNENGVQKELLAEDARRVIGIMKTLLFLTKAFGTPPAPFDELCSIAQSVITGTKTHLCRLYSYNVIAFLLRGVSDEDVIKSKLPLLSTSQLKHVNALLKEANHLPARHGWSFQYTPLPSMTPPVSTDTATSVSLPQVDSPATMEQLEPPQAESPAMNKADIAPAVTHEVPTLTTGQVHNAAQLNVASTELPVTATEASATQDGSIPVFKHEWYRMLSSQFSYSGQGTKSPSHDREAWKKKNEVLTDIVDHVQRITGNMTLGHCGSQLIAIFEGILKFESAIPIILGALKLLLLLLQNCGNDLMRHVKSWSIVELVFDRLKDTNHKVQSAAIASVAYIIKYADKTMVLECIKKALCHKSPLARIAMCNVICGSVPLPEAASRVSQELQAHKSQLVGVISSMLSDKNLKVRTAAMECTRALDDPCYIPPKVAVATPVTASLRATRSLPANTELTVSIRRPSAFVNRSISTGNRPQRLDSITVDSVAIPPQNSVTNDSCGAPIPTATPVKRKLVRRFLKRSIQKQNGDSSTAMTTVSIQSTYCTPKDLPIPSGPSNHTQADNEMPTADSVEIPDVNMHQSDNCVQVSQQVGQQSLLSSSPQKDSVETRESTSIPPLNFVSINTEPSAAEIALLEHIPDTILNKVARRGSSRRGFTEGLYELSKWLQGHLDVTSALKEYVIEFVSNCTNNFREQTKTGRAALYSFLEDFALSGLCGNNSLLVIEALSADISNPQVRGILKQFGLYCDTVSLVSALLDSYHSSDDAQTVSSILEVLCHVITPATVSTLDQSTVSVLVKFCTPISTSNLESSHQAAIILDLLNLSAPVSGNHLLPEEAVTDVSPHRDMSPCQDASPKSSAISPHQDMSPELATIPSIETTPADADVFFVVPDRFNKALSAESPRLQNAISTDLYESMFVSNQEDNLERACVFWETFLRQPTDLLQAILTGEKLRLELLTWLCHVLLRGACENIVLRCLGSLFSKVKEVDLRLTTEESSLLLDALAIYHERTPGDALIAFDHLLQVINITPEMVSGYSTDYVWRNALSEHLASCMTPSLAATPNCQEASISVVVSPSTNDCDIDNLPCTEGCMDLISTEPVVETVDDIGNLSGTEGCMDLISTEPVVETDMTECRHDESPVDTTEPVASKEDLTLTRTSLGSSPNDIDAIQIEQSSETTLPSPELMAMPAQESASPSTSASSPASTSASGSTVISSLPEDTVSGSNHVTCQSVSPRDSAVKTIPSDDSSHIEQSSSPLFDCASRSLLPPDASPVSHNGDMSIDSAKEVCDAATSPIIIDGERHSNTIELSSTVADVGSPAIEIAEEQLIARTVTIGLDATFAQDRVATVYSSDASSEFFVSKLKSAGGNSPVDNGDATTKTHFSSIEVHTGLLVDKVDPEKHDVIEIGIQTTPSVTGSVNPEDTDDSMLQAADEDTENLYSRVIPSSLDSTTVSSESSAAVESARSSISRILSRHLHGGIDADKNDPECFHRSMQLVEVILSDCSYVANFCLLSNYKDYHALVPSFYDEGMVEGCIERAKRVLENLSLFSDQQVLSALSPVLIDACHISILRLCKEVEVFTQLSQPTDKVIEAIVALVELFTTASGSLDGRALLQYCSVVIHCLALPKACFQHNVKLYNGLSRLILNALEQDIDVLARLLVVCVELSVQSLRRGDGGRILLAMLRLTKILQVQILLRLECKNGVNSVTRSELYKCHSTYVGMLRNYLRGSGYNASIETRLQDALRQSNVLMRSLCHLET
ncbi:HEAT repeat containing protein, putative [Babesia ovis]|uniref:HEAT repeat containing protein, putative n=1 Tax=Babesia ovis TaxID=5869 RepID=A0A9W5WV06_BABOV|nr:HEAT repeat containing protein, putative [Babesia ovis]